MIEWKKGDPPRDGKTYLVCEKWPYCHVVNLEMVAGIEVWMNSLGCWRDCNDAGFLFYAEINPPEVEK